MAEGQLTIDPEVASGLAVSVSREGDLLRRMIRLNSSEQSSFLPSLSADQDLDGAWWLSYLKAAASPSAQASGSALNVIDLFSSVGGLSLGFTEAARALGYKVRLQLAVDTDRYALPVFQANHRARQTLHLSVSDIVSGRVAGRGERARFATEPRAEVPELEALVDRVDVILAGPPCQGHSTLNNKSRSDDPRNLLYLNVPAVAIATRAKAVIIENVRNVVNDKNGVVQTTMELFRQAGYHVTSHVLAADQLGWPQTRHRFFMVATLPKPALDLPLLASGQFRSPRPVSWLLKDLARQKIVDGDIMNSVPKMSQENLARVRWLFDHDEYDAPNEIRPDCHKDGHTYPSVYGRMHWDRPAGTITGGFLSPGRGRFIHPRQPRVLTPREAARIQGFPDWFMFRPDGSEPPTRAQLAKWIGDAVPPILGYVAGLSALAALT
jgi:DNA (cytosine-5)-methyltransferase 1